MVENQIINLGKQYPQWDGPYYSVTKCWHGAAKEDATVLSRDKAQHYLATFRQLGFDNAHIEEVL